MAISQSAKEKMWMLIGATVLTGCFTTGMVLCTRSTDRVKKGDGSATKADSVIYAIEDIFSTMSSVGNPNATGVTRTSDVSKDYKLKPEELNKMSDSSGVVNSTSDNGQTLAYMRVKFGTLKTFSNAKLIGVDDYVIEYRLDGANSRNFNYSAKSLLFELDSNKIMSVISTKDPFFVGQRYNLSYYTFERDDADKKTMESDVLPILLGGGNYSDSFYYKYYDGGSGRIREITRDDIEVIADKELAHHDGILLDYVMNTRNQN